MKMLNTVVLACATVLASTSQAVFITEEYSTYTLQYQQNLDFGAPFVSPDETAISFFPDDMKVSVGSNFNFTEDETNWTTTLIITPKTGFNFSSFTFFEDGNYILESEGSDPILNPIEIPGPSIDITAKLFVRDINTPSNVEVITFEETLDQEGDLDYWSLSGDVDISNYTDGFYLTIQNTAKFEGVYGNNMFFQKEYVGIDFGESATAPIPLLGSSWFFASGFVGLLFVRKKLKAKV